MLPFSERVSFNGVPDELLTRTLDAIAINPPLEPALFEPGSRRRPMSALAALVAGARRACRGGPADSPTPAWPQWGGPNRNFVTGRRPRDVLARGRTAAAVAAAARRRVLLDRHRWRDALHALPRRRRRRGGGDGRGDRTDAVGRALRRAVHGVVQRTARAGAARRAAHRGDRLVTVSAGGLMNSFDRAHRRAQWRRDLLEGSPDALARLRLLEQPARLQEHDHHDRRWAGARRGRARRRHRSDRLARAGFPERLLVAHPHRSRRPSGAHRVHLRRDRRARSGDRRARVEPRARGRSGRERRHADLGRRSPAVRVLGLQRRKPGAEARADRRRSDGRRSLVEQAGARALRQRRQARSAHLRLERRLRLRAVRGHRRRDRRDVVAGSQRHPRDADRRRQPADHPRRGRQPGAGHAGRCRA